MKSGTLTIMNPDPLEETKLADLTNLQIQSSTSINKLPSINTTIQITKDELIDEETYNKITEWAEGANNG